MNHPFVEPKQPVGNVAELFAGVGGFRIGLGKAGFKTVYSNQWEPSTKIQHASNVYIANFGADGHSNEDIAKVKKIPVAFDLLVGGFPCQDYSVAKTLGTSKGLKGKKGVLWWEILRLVQLHKPKLIFLENVDRLLKSPASQRGRDFAVMLKTLGDEGYIVEWRVINSAEYGFPQRRIRVFIVAKKTKSLSNGVTPEKYVIENGVLARALPIETADADSYAFSLDTDVEKISKNFNKGAGVSPFLNSGVYLNGDVFTLKSLPKSDLFTKSVLKDILQEESEVSEAFLVPFGQLKDWKYLKGAKKIERIHKKSGSSYVYAEGAMAFPDLTNRPSRTILTAEGGTTPSRFKHIISTKIGYRRLTPIELERLNGFPDDWTRFDHEGKVVPDTKRAFFMGNALVVGLIELVGRELAKELQAMKPVKRKK
jgi:DNA (cytosine-5)-methyltransferase 1